MKNKNSNSLLLLSGIILGGAAVHFLKSKRGKEVVNLLLEKSEDLKTSVIDQSQNIIDQGKVILDTAVKTGESLIDNSIHQEESFGESMTKKLEDTMDDFQQGIKNAKDQLKKA